MQKRLRAYRLGIHLTRSASFQIPDSILLNGKRHRLHLPIEPGIKVAFLEVLLADCYQTEHIGESVQTVLDIGANVGLFCLAARQAYPKALIHAYEPNPNLEPYLRTQTQTASCDYFMEAVQQEAGKVTLLLNSDSVLTRSEPQSTGKIPAVAFRTAIERLGGRVDFLKLDCEGAEWDIWQDRQAWKNIRHLSMEYHLSPNHTHEEVQEVVSNLGFTIRNQMPATDFGLLLASRYVHA